MFFKQTIITVITVAALTACGDQNPSSNPSASDPITASQTTANMGDTIQLSSKAGDITVPRDISRIAVLDSNALSTFITLGAADKVVAVPKGTPLPQALHVFADAKYQDIGTLKEPNLEKVAATNPQAIVMNGRMEKVMDQVKGIAPTYFLDVDYKQYWTSFQEQTLNLAKMVGKTAEAQKELAAIASQVAEIKTKTQGKTALIILVNNDKIAAYGPNSRFGNIHELYGFTPIDPSIKVGLHGMAVSPEFIAEKNPDYLFVIDRSAAITDKKDGAKAVLNNDFVNKTKAAKDGHIVYLNSANWYLMNTGLGGMKAMTSEIAASIQ